MFNSNDFALRRCDVHLLFTIIYVPISNIKALVIDLEAISIHSRSKSVLWELQAFSLFQVSVDCPLSSLQR